MKSISRLLVVLSIVAGPLAAQATPKRALTQADWDTWRSINGATLSNDGRWAVYVVSELNTDGSERVQLLTQDSLRDPRYAGDD